MPLMRAPMALSMWARSCTCGSQAAFRIRVCPWLTTAAISTCSVPVTEGSSKNISAPVSGPCIAKS